MAEDAGVRRGDALPPEDDSRTRTESLPRFGLRIGDVLSRRFRIGRQLGRGGMGEVFEAEDLELGGRVALKVIRHEHAGDADFLMRFRREVQLARQVTHPNVCRLFDVGRDESTGCVYFTMELLDGQTLHRYLHECGGRLPADLALPLAEQIAAGLGALHEHGIVHRDLKPANIMVVRSTSGASTRAVIGDFGLARATASEAAAGPAGDSQPSAIVGTPDYMAPEQLMGRPVTAASDIYAYGITLYEMVTGTRPFRRLNAIENAVQRIVEPPKPPRDHVPDLPEIWQAAILQCLEREPEARPASASDVVRALRGYSVTPAPVQAAVGAPAPSRRGWMGWVAVAAALLTAAAGVFVAPRLMRPASPEIAVLPFKVTGEDPALRVFADTLLDSLSRRVAQLDAQVKVAPAGEVRSLGVLTALDAKAKLGARTAVEGTVSREGGRVKVEVSFVDTSGARPPSSAVVEDDPANVAGLEDALMAKLGEAIRAARQAQAMAPATGPGAHDFYVQARGYLQRTDQLSSIDSAITVSRRALEIDPNYALAHSALGEALYAKYELTRDPKWVNEAMASGRKGVELNAGLAETHVSLGRIHVGTGRAEDAVKDFEKALAIDAASTEALQGMGNALTALKRYGEAEAAYRKGIALKPGDWTGYKMLGIYHARREEWDQAIEQYKMVISLTPDNAHGYVNTAYFYLQKADLDAAKRNLLRALELDPTRTSAVANLGKVYYELGEYTLATDMYQRAIKLTSTRSSSLWGNLGRAYLRSGNAAQAKQALAEAIKIAESELVVNPKNAEIQVRLADYRALSGQREGAESLLRRALAGAPDNREVMVAAAEIHATLGDQAKAVALAKKALASGYSRKALLRSVPLRSLADRIDSK